MKNVRHLSTFQNHIYSNPNVEDDDILSNIPIFVLELNEKLAATSNGSATNKDKAFYLDPPAGSTNDLSIGSLVEVLNDVSEEPLYGVIRWMGMESRSKFVLVGVELESEQEHLPLTLTDGTHNGERYFRCSGRRALFVPLKQCYKDSRFQERGAAPAYQFTEAFDKVRLRFVYYLFF